MSGDITTDSEKKEQKKKVTVTIPSETDRILNAILEQMEFTRIQNQLTIREFSETLGMGHNSYAKIKERQTLSLKYFLNFCITFGYDISDLLINNSWRSEEKIPIKEFAVQFHKLDPKTMQEVYKTISNSTHGDDSVKKRAMITLKAEIEAKESVMIRDELDDE